MEVSLDLNRMKKNENSDFWKQPVGSGPYKVQIANSGKEAVLTVNEKYTGQIPQIERIRYKLFAMWCSGLPRHDRSNI